MSVLVAGSLSTSPASARRNTVIVVFIVPFMLDYKQSMQRSCCSNNRLSS
jgi:hypothetical protein